jgi:hypothetical protein
MNSGQDAAKWLTGPPAPMAATVIARVLELVTFVLTTFWVRDVQELKIPCMPQHACTLSSKM